MTGADAPEPGAMVQGAAEGGEAAEVLSRLRESRRVTVGISLASGAAGLVPLPLLPDLAVGALRCALLTRLASKREVQLSYGDALRVCGHEGGVGLRRLAASAAPWTRITRSLFMLLRFEDMGRTFLYGTYTDYYLLRYHRGSAVSGRQADMLGRVVRQATSSAHLDVISALFYRAVSDAVQVGLFLPRRLWRVALALLSSEEGEELEQIKDLEQDGAGFFSRGIRLVERQLDRAGAEAMEALLEGFDRAWIEAGGQGLVVRPPAGPDNEGEEERADEA